MIENLDLNRLSGETMKYSMLLVIPLLMNACTHKMSARDPADRLSAKPTVIMTASFRSLAELPRCDAGSERMNAYISERDSFVQCRGFFWRDVKPGDASGKFIAREPLRYNEWVDSDTRLRWSLSKPDEVDVSTAKSNICSQGWKLPTRDELLVASINGLFEGLKARGGVAFDRAWTANLDAIAGVSKGALQALLPEAPAEMKAGAYCVASLN